MLIQFWLFFKFLILIRKHGENLSYVIGYFNWFVYLNMLNISYPVSSQKKSSRYKTQFYNIWIFIILQQL